MIEGVGKLTPSFFLGANQVADPLSHMGKISGENGYGQGEYSAERYDFPRQVDPVSGVTFTAVVPKFARPKDPGEMFLCPDCQQIFPVGEAVRVQGTYYCTTNKDGPDRLRDIALNRNPRVRPRKIIHRVNP